MSASFATNPTHMSVYIYIYIYILRIVVVLFHAVGRNGKEGGRHDDVCGRYWFRRSTKVILTSFIWNQCVTINLLGII
jgi:hypothetical protein